MSIAAVSDVVARCQTLLEDPGGKWADYNYLKGFMNQANEDLNVEMDAYNLKINEQVTVLSSVPAGTSDLSGYMTTGQPLENMLDPVLLEWRNVGDSDAQWRVVPRRNKVIDTTTAAAVLSWEVRNQNIYFSPSINNVDLRVRYDQIVLDFADPTDAILRGSLNVLAYATCELVAGLRGGLAASGAPLVSFFEKKLAKAKDNFESLLTKRDQRTRRKFARANNAGGAGLEWSIPIVNSGT